MFAPAPTSADFWPLQALPGQGNQRPQYVVSPDGRFLIHPVVEEDTSPIIVILNWKPGS